MPCRSRRSRAYAVRRELCGVAIGVILLLCSFGTSFGVFSGAEELFVFVAAEQQSVDIFGRVLQAVLVQHTGAARQAHTCQAIVLRDNKVARAYAVHQCKIYAGGTFFKGQGLCAVAPDLVGSIT